MPSKRELERQINQLTEQVNRLSRSVRDSEAKRGFNLRLSEYLPTSLAALLGEEVPTGNNIFIEDETKVVRFPKMVVTIGTFTEKIYFVSRSNPQQREQVSFKPDGTLSTEAVRRILGFKAELDQPVIETSFWAGSSHVEGLSPTDTASPATIIPDWASSVPAGDDIGPAGSVY